MPQRYIGKKDSLKRREILEELRLKIPSSPKRRSLLVRIRDCYDEVIVLTPEEDKEFSWAMGWQTQTIHKGLYDPGPLERIELRHRKLLPFFEE